MLALRQFLTAKTTVSFGPTEIAPHWTVAVGTLAINLAVIARFIRMFVNHEGLSKVPMINRIELRVGGLISAPSLRSCFGDSSSGCIDRLILMEP
jgi:hypothetical protein